MFGLFKNNKEKEKEESSEFLALVKKWEAFLAKIDNRFNESLGSAEEALLDSLVESDFDFHPTIVAWSGIKSQLSGLTDKIEKTFQEKVKVQMLAYKEHYELIDEEQKGVQLEESIYHRIERFEIVIEGKIAQKFYDHAIVFLNEDFKCTQCGGKIEVRKDIFRSHYVSCGYCNTVNTFTPKDKIYQIQNVIDKMAKYSALEEWQKMQNAQDVFREIRPPFGEEDKTEYTAGFKNREVTERAFWTKYLKERIEFLPEFEETLEHDLGVKMKFFYEERKRELNY